MYLAGFFDGEGCIQINKTDTELSRKYNSNARYYLMISVTQVDPRPLQLFRKQYGGTIGLHDVKTPTKRTNWVWRAQGNHADKFLLDVLPYLVVKKEEAELAIKFRQTFWPDNKRHGKIALTAEEISQRECFRLEMKSLKKRNFDERT